MKESEIDIIEQLNKIVAEYEKVLTWKKSGTVDEKVSHTLGQYRQMADNAIFKCKSFIEDVKTQFKALEMITEGLTSHGLNHGQKRVIANHIITMLRSMVDKINRIEYDYSTSTFDRYDFFRSDSPERKLHERHRELKYKSEAQEKILKTLQEVHPDIYKSLTSSDEIPF